MKKDEKDDFFIKKYTYRLFQIKVYVLDKKYRMSTLMHFLTSEIKVHASPNHF
jgi:hypothetical protein